ncbi:MAG: energy-coupling factor transporter transmembrane protein EcfT [Propionibacteriaceae bacterium]|nr:energy-coupling factor transporter transmembrane protein EcfT [Propionibacteriaceae bacterium]
MSAPVWPDTPAVAAERGQLGRELETLSKSTGLDPRTKVGLVLAVSLTVMSPDGSRFVPAALVLGAALALSERAWGRAVGLPLVGAALAVGGWLAPLWWPHPLVAVLALVCSFTVRLVACCGVGAHLIATTSPTALSAALRAMRAPRAVAVTMAVMLRFFPVVAHEAGAVLDAMRLRGLAGAGRLARHPILSLERFTVPMIAASLRASEDLSAGAILRGLGSRRRPTAAYPPRLGWPDGAVGLAVGGLVALTLSVPPVLA